MFPLQHIQKFIYSTPIRLIVGYYFLVTVVFAFLLWLPISLNEGESISSLNALFTATSALSATGLTSVSIVETFNTFGLLLMIIMMQIGGLGITMMSTAIWLIAGRKISMKERSLIMTDQNQSSLSGGVKLVKSILVYFCTLQFIFVLILGHYFFFMGYEDNYLSAMFNGLFLTVAATTNAGFDLTGTSLIPFRNDFFLQIVFMFLMFFGMMGFPVILDLERFVVHKRMKKRFRFSIYTKITMVTTLALWGVGIVGFYLFESQNFLADKGFIDSFFYATFHSLTTRNGGLVTTNINAFSQSTLTLFGILMIIGASPNSAGGGIRTTTFAIMCVSLLTFARGKEHVNLYGREIESKTVHKAFTIYVCATFLVSFFTLLISAVDSLSLMETFFEVSSAFGTTGLSLGITPTLSVISRTSLIIIMFIGRLGIATTLHFFRNKAVPAKVRYPKTDLIIG